jgi:hypothetical protein
MKQIVALAMLASFPAQAQQSGVTMYHWEGHGPFFSPEIKISGPWQIQLTYKGEPRVFVTLYKKSGGPMDVWTPRPPGTSATASYPSGDYDVFINVSGQGIEPFINNEWSLSVIKLPE